jgi:F-type H+-transporting ATPase subunit epsilon
MAEKSIQLKVISKNGIKFNGEILSITLPSLGGEITILPDHIPLLSGLKNGIIKITDSAKRNQNITITSGFTRLINNICVVTIEEENLVKAS